MEGKKIAFWGITSLIGVASAYFLFIKKDYYGLTWFEKFGKQKHLDKIDRNVAIAVIEQASGGKKMEGTYDNDYLISRATALLLKNEFFYLGDRKFITKTGRETSNK